MPQSFQDRWTFIIAIIIFLLNLIIIILSGCKLDFKKFDDLQLDFKLRQKRKKIKHVVPSHKVELEKKAIHPYIDAWITNWSNFKFWWSKNKFFTTSTTIIHHNQKFIHISILLINSEKKFILLVVVYIYIVIVYLYPTHTKTFLVYFVYASRSWLSVQIYILSLSSLARPK